MIPKRWAVTFGVWMCEILIHMARVGDIIGENTKKHENLGKKGGRGRRSDCSVALVRTLL